MTSDFQTPVHNFAYFTFQSVRWNTRVFISNEECFSENVTCPSLPAVGLKIKEKITDIPRENEGHIRYSNMLVIECEGRYVAHVDEFNADNDENLVFAPSSTVFPCHSKLFSYRVVVRPQYVTD